MNSNKTESSGVTVSKLLLIRVSVFFCLAYFSIRSYGIAESIDRYDSEQELENAKPNDTNPPSAAFGKMNS